MDISLHRAPPGTEHILTPEAVAFVVDLHDRFEGRRQELLDLRRERRDALVHGASMRFLPETAAVRSQDWSVAAHPHDLVHRRVEITGPVDAKMMINALNSGANVFMADLEDATSPTWVNVVSGQANLLEAQRGTLHLDTGARSYRLEPNPATLLVRPRGWHLTEKHLRVDGEKISASLFDAGLYLYHGGRVAVERGSGPYFYLPKLESHLEARLWNDVFMHAQSRLGMPHGTVRATVLIETIWAAHEMDEILFELADHASGLNAGRWDYIFSVIKAFRHDSDFVLPDRAQVGMTVPFMRSYTDLMVQTCHRRGAYAIGGMAAFIPNRNNPKVTAAALEKVAADKRREAQQGCDGTWVAHPDLVEVARKEFDQVMGDEPNQLGKSIGYTVRAADLTDVTIDGGTVTEAGLRTNISVGIRYLAAWLDGQGAASLDDLMEDAATAEISRSQIWQWIRHRTQTDDGAAITEERVRRLIDEECAGLEVPHLVDARKVFEEVALGDHFPDFLTLAAYELID
ncbi:MAG TPA: malate synthase A [Acidimicrobiia bacterium]|nr:malate synthase A [Acidimicrobiia bacterium]